MNPITFLYDQEPLVERDGSYYSKQLNTHIPINGLSIGQIKNMTMCLKDLYKK